MNYLIQPEDPVKTRWQHLCLLVEFAFELKRALTSINEQSFNHFVLKMGKNSKRIKTCKTVWLILKNLCF